MIHIQEQLTGAAVLDPSLPAARKALSGIGVHMQLLLVSKLYTKIPGTVLPKSDARGRDKPSVCLLVTTITLALSDASEELLSTSLITQVGVRGEIREAITEPPHALYVLGIYISTVWVAFSRPVVN